MASKFKPPIRPLGTIGVRQSSGRIEEEFIKDLQFPDGMSVFQEMSYNDPVIGGCLYLIETLARKANWHVEAASTETGDEEAAKFLESCMNDLDQPWSQFITEVMSMVVYGFSFHEIVYKTRRGPLETKPDLKSRYTDGAIGWQCLPIRSQATLDEWVMDDATGTPTAFRQDPSRVGSRAPRVDIPLDGNLLFKTKAARGNPEGWSILRRAYRSWYFARYLEEIEAIGIERGLAGIPVIQPPEDLPLFDPDNEDMVEMLNWADNLVANLRQDKNHGVVLPGGWSIKLISAEGASGAPDADTVIRRHQYRMASAMLADVILMGGDRTGSFALADTKQNLLVASVQAILNDIADTLNTEAVPRLFAANNQQLEQYPRIVATDIMPITISELAVLLRTFQLDVTKDQKLLNYLLGVLQMPQLTTEEFTALLANQTEEKKNDRLQDEADNTFKQSNELGGA